MADYWAGRVAAERALAKYALQNKKRWVKYVASRTRRITQQINKTQSDIAQMIEGFYQKYADSGEMTLEAAKTILSSADAKITLEQYYKLVAAELEGDENAAIILDAAEARRKITRLEAINLQLDGITKNVGRSAENIINETLGHVGEDAFMRTIYDAQRVMGYGYEFTTINAVTIQQLADMRWTAGGNLSERLWGHVDNLSVALQDTLNTGLSTGQSIKEMTDALTARTGVFNSACKRLVHTEAAHVTEQCTLKAYDEIGVEKYKYLATLDLRTSEACRELDGQVFDVRQAQVGVNYPPMHPNCRSTTVSMLEDEDEDERIARGRDGKSYYVPANMTYKEWYEKYGNVRDVRNIDSSVVARSIGMSQTQVQTSIPKNLTDRFADFEPLTLTSEEESAISMIQKLSRDTGFEYGVVITDGNISEPITSNLPDAVGIPKKLIKKGSTIIHTHTNVTPLSVEDFSRLCNQDVEKIINIAYNNDIYTVSAGSGLSVSEEEFFKIAKGIRTEVDDDMEKHPDFIDWTFEERNYMAIREQAYRIARHFKWYMQGGNIDDG